MNNLSQAEEERMGRLNQGRAKDVQREETTGSPQAGQQERISNITAVFMIAVALLFDGVQAFFEWILIGFVVNWLINILAWLTFFVWFKFKSVSFMNLKRSAIFNGGFFLELIPLVAELPLWTATIVTMVMMVKLEDKIGKKLTGAVIK